MTEEPYFYHPLENIEDIEVFEDAMERKRLTPKLNEARPYVYFTLEYYDKDNGIRGGGGLGVLAADTRRVAERMQLPFVTVTPFYPVEMHQRLAAYEELGGGQSLLDSEATQNVAVSVAPIDEERRVNYADFGFSYVDSVFIKCCGNLCKLDVIEKRFKTTRILAITEPNFGSLYQGLSGSDHRLYQEVALGFGGYQALKLVGLRPAIIQLNEVATFFAALARLDELCKNGMDFYEAMVYVRKHTLYTNHTLVQAAEAEFSHEQFERFVYPNVHSKAVRRWLDGQFKDGEIRLSSVATLLAELKNGVSKLHAAKANYQDANGERVKFKAVTNGIDVFKWVAPQILTFYQKCGIIDSIGCVSANYREALENLTAEKIRELKHGGREIMNQILENYPDQNGEILEFNTDDFVFDFKRRFVDYKRPELAFQDPARLRGVLEPYGAHYILTGRIHAGDENMVRKLQQILAAVERDDYLKTHVHYLADYDEKLAFGLSCGCNTAINVPIVGLEACGTSWEKDVANLQLLISTADGGVADLTREYHLDVTGSSDAEEAESLYARMGEALEIWGNDFDLEYRIGTQLEGFLPIISGARMVKDYLNMTGLTATK